MRKTLAIFTIALLGGFLGARLATVHAQSGQVIFLGANPGTTLATNCPATPATPSVCDVGDGIWMWQNATTGWFKPAPPSSAVAGVTSVTVNGGTPQSGAVVLTIPTKVTISATAPTVTGTIQ